MKEKWQVDDGRIEQTESDREWIEMLESANAELRAWRDRAVAACAKRQCEMRDRRMAELEQCAEQAERERDRLRAAIESAPCPAEGSGRVCSDCECWKRDALRRDEG